MPLFTIVRNSYTHAQNHLYMLTVQDSEAEILNFLNLPWGAQGKGWFATDSQGCIQRSDSDSRTGTFHQTQVTAGDTACNVNGVLQHCVCKTLENKFNNIFNADILSIKNVDRYKLCNTEFPCNVT